jgi:hypothetical protein
MIYRTYVLRSPDARPEDQTTTPHPGLAEAASGLLPGTLTEDALAGLLLPGTLTEDALAGLLQQWYAARRKMGAPACPWTEALLREVEQEDGLPPGSISGTMRPPGGISGN